MYLCVCSHTCSCICECICPVARYACVSHVQYLLPEYLARGAVCCLNKGSQSPALKRTFIKHFRSLHLFLLAKTGKLGRLLCHITLCALSLKCSCVGYPHILFLMFFTLAPCNDHRHLWVNKANLTRCDSGASKRGHCCF